MIVWCKANGIDPRLYGAWVEIRRRCRGSSRSGWKHYGGRGISVCEGWASFAAFAIDMGPHPGNGLSLDRKSNSKGYHKWNCRWATKSLQTRNRRYTKLTMAIAKKIRGLYTPASRWNPSPTSGRALATKFGVSAQLISDIVHMEIWV